MQYVQLRSSVTSRPLAEANISGNSVPHAYIGLQGPPPSTLAVSRLSCSLILDDAACGGGIVSGASFSETWGLASQVAAGPPGVNNATCGGTTGGRVSGVCHW